MAKFNFLIEKEQKSARAATLRFENGIDIQTPVFMPVGTVGSVKALGQDELEELGYRLILANTYHIHLRPGKEVMDHFGGIKNFISWPHIVLTDSGGFQAFSLSELTKYDDHGVHFKSHLDGSSHTFTPQNVLDIQASIGSDIVMPLDDCAPYPADAKRLAESLVRTHRWIKESHDHYKEQGYDQTQNLFGIIQGGVEPELRIESARAVCALDLPGFAVGGLSVGEKSDQFRTALAATTPEMPVEKPRYLMGVGTIPEILFAVEHGIDMFDCVLPTRNARNGQVFTSKGKLNLRAEYNRLETGPIDPECGCKVCKRYSLGYIRHLHKSKEILALSLSSYHNLYFMIRFMENLRKSILDESFTEYRDHWLKVFSS